MEYFADLLESSDKNYREVDLNREVVKTLRLLGKQRSCIPVIIGDKELGILAVLSAGSKLKAPSLPDSLTESSTCFLRYKSEILKNSNTQLKEELAEELEKLSTQGKILTIFLSDFVWLHDQELMSEASSPNSSQFIVLASQEEFLQYRNADQLVGVDKLEPVRIRKEVSREEIEELELDEYHEYERRYGVKYPESIIELAARQVEGYLSGYDLRSEVLDVLDEVGMLASLQWYLDPPDEEMSELLEEWWRVHEEKSYVVKQKRFEESARLRDREKEIERDLEEKVGARREGCESALITVTEDMIDTVLGERLHDRV